MSFRATRHPQCDNQSRKRRSVLSTPAPRLGGQQTSAEACNKTDARRPLASRRRRLIWAYVQRDVNREAANDLNQNSRLGAQPQSLEVDEQEQHQLGDTRAAQGTSWFVCRTGTKALYHHVQLPTTAQLLNDSKGHNSAGEEARASLANN